jgi:hypothetical protein
MPDQHSMSIIRGIVGKISPKLARQIEKLDLALVGERVEKTDTGISIKSKGIIEVRGTAANVQEQEALLRRLRELTGGRTIKNLTETKSDRNRRR